jgi:hypothetical protein
MEDDRTHGPQPGLAVHVVVNYTEGFQSRKEKLRMSAYVIVQVLSSTRSNQLSNYGVPDHAAPGFWTATKRAKSAGLGQAEGPATLETSNLVIFV